MSANVKYKLLQLIGEGTYGKVYKSQNNKTGEIVAIKKMYFDVACLRELNTLSAIGKHKNIAEWLDIAINSNSKVFVIMKMYDLTLAEMIKSFRMKINLDNLARDIFSGVHHLHSKNIIHRDIKPQNILFDEKSEVFVLIDFGLSRNDEINFTPKTQEVCTLWYRPPELLLGLPKGQSYSFEVDLWSIGCVLFEVLTGKPLVESQGEVSQLKGLSRKFGTDMICINPEDAHNIEEWKILPSKCLLEILEKTEPERGVETVYCKIIDDVMHFQPKKRKSAENILKEYFGEIVKSTPYSIDSLVYKYTSSTGTSAHMVYMADTLHHVYIENHLSHPQTMETAIKIIEKYLQLVDGQSLVDIAEKSESPSELESSKLFKIYHAGLILASWILEKKPIDTFNLPNEKEMEKLMIEICKTLNFCLFV